MADRSLKVRPERKTAKRLLSWSDARALAKHTKRHTHCTVTVDIMFALVKDYSLQFICFEEIDR